MPSSTERRKVCNKCKKRRAAKFFKPYKRKDRKDDLSARCRDCIREDNRERWIARKQLQKDIEEGRALPAVSRLPADPFREWLTRDALPRYASIREFCEATGLQERRVFDVVKGRQKNVSLDYVDKAVTRDGSTFLWELYPELYP